MSDAASNTDVVIILNLHRSHLPWSVKKLFRYLVRFGARIGNVVQKC